MFIERIKPTVWQIPLLIVTAGVIAIGVNQLRPDGIPLVGEWSEQARITDAAGDSMVIGLEEAGRLFERATALFLDARPESQYAEGHIAGALNLPWQEAESRFLELADRMEGADTIIVYCDGEHCDLSHQLALFLKKMGFENVRVLVNGWTVWRQAGRPIRRGAQ
jgi:rhodanese-related sulfurtransferase